MVKLMANMACADEMLHSVASQLGLKSLPASGDICRLLIIFANSLAPDQAQQNIGPDLDPNCLTLL